MLTKSLFVAGHRCPKLLWWQVHDSDAVELQPGKVLQDLFDQSLQVRELARTQFPNGVRIAYDERSVRLEATSQAIESGATVLFDAAFEADGVFMVTDILAKTASGWRVIDVTSSKEAKDEHILDAAVQAHVLVRNGIELDDLRVMHLSNEFRHPDAGALFALTDVTKDVRKFAPNVSEEVHRQLVVLDGPLPTVAIGRHCGEPRECVFKKRCFPDDERHISNLYRCGPATFPKYIARGIHRVDHLPPNEKLQDAQKRQIRALNSGEMIVESTLARDLEPFDVQPLGFLDFETILRAVPVWDGMMPWEPAAAQFSYHEWMPDAGYRHEAYLAEGPNDCRPELAERVVA
ncbi:MAG: DUF2779 domain-containing protein, partial [Gemmatimonadota bacterium]